MILLLFKNLFDLLINSRRKFFYIIISCIFFSSTNLMQENISFYEKIEGFSFMSFINLSVIFSLSILLCRRVFFNNNQYGHSENIFSESFEFVIGLSLIHIIQIPSILFNFNYSQIINLEINNQFFSFIAFILIYILAYFDIISLRLFKIFFKKNDRGPINLELVSGDNFYRDNYKILDQKDIFHKVRINNEYRNAFYLTNNKELKIFSNNQNKINKLTIGKKGNKGFYNDSGNIKIKFGDKLIIDKNINHLKNGWNEYTIDLDNPPLEKISACVKNNNRIYLNMSLINKKSNHNKNIIILCLDGLRKDMLGLYTGDKSLSKNIDGFFKDYLIYENAFAQAEWTFPTFSSMMTGQYTSHHGVRNKDYRVELPKNDEILPEIMQKNEYNTFGYFSCFRTSPHFGFGRGFNKTIYKNNASKVSHYDVNNSAIDFLKQSRNQNNFIFLHYMDVHPPYLNNNSFSDNTAKYNFDMNKLYNSKIEMDTKEAEFIKIMAANKIRELDFQLGRLFSDLANLDMLDNTAFILCSDHGVNLPSDGTPNWQNKLFTKERLNVPFLIRCPWLKKNNKFPIDYFVESSIDLLPTVLDIAGINVTNTRDYSLSCLPKMNEEKKLKKYAVSEYIFEGDYKCKIHTSKFIYLREFNWYKDVDEKETIFDTKTNRKIEIDSDHYMNLLSYFKTLNKKLKLETIESLKAKSN